MSKNKKKSYLKIFDDCFKDFIKKEDDTYDFMSKNLNLDYDKYVIFCKENNLKIRSRFYCIYRYLFKRTIDWKLVKKNKAIPRYPFFGSSLEELVGVNLLKILKI